MPAPAALELIVQPMVGPGESAAADRWLLDAVAARRIPGALRIFELPGDVLSLGRYHLAPPPVGSGGATLVRRDSGGRVVPSGTGFVGLSLVLPHRSALVADAPLALAPAQVMNRCVRGILAACRRAGVEAFYPGRDTITVDGRILGMVSFEVEASGALLFEAVLACGRDFATLPGLLDALDPTGVVPARIIAPAEVTSLGRELDRVLSAVELAQWLAAGYDESFGIAWTERTLECSTLPAIDLEVRLRQRKVDPALDRRGTVATQLGVLEARFSLRGGRLGEALLVGDFIAGSPAIAALEAGLVGCPADAAAVDAVVRRVFADPASFVLGIGPLTTITEAFARGMVA